jgi:FixJ family two-component response regulator
MSIIFITGYCDVPVTAKAMRECAAEFLIKPFDADLLLGAINNAIQRSYAAQDMGYTE